MQRRWAAVCVVFFLVMAASAYSVMALAEAPTPDVEGDTYGDGDSFREGGTAYTVSVGEGSGEITYEETVENEQTFANNSVVDYANASYNVSVEGGDDPGAFALVEEVDVPAVLADDPDVENDTFTRDDGTEVVVYRNGTTRPLEEYLDRDRVRFAEGDTIEQGGERKSVANVTAEGVLVRWRSTEERSIGLEEGETFTLDGTEYVATFPDESTVVLSTDIERYDSYEENVAYHQQRVSGLLYVVIFSAGSSFLLAALAFLPRRG